MAITPTVTSSPNVFLMSAITERFLNVGRHRMPSQCRPSPNAFSMLAVTERLFDVSRHLGLIRWYFDHVRVNLGMQAHCWINTDDDNDYFATVNLCPTMLFTHSDGVNVANVPR
ncbi:unnamed protein product [Sphagnum balticum]